MRTKKYNDYDILTLYVKKVKAQQIIENYKHLVGNLYQKPITNNMKTLLT